MSLYKVRYIDKQFAYHSYSIIYTVRKIVTKVFVLVS